MPQVDLEKLVSACAGGCSDRKITCETLTEQLNLPESSPDSPPESFWLSGDAEHDWWDRNAVVYERNESTKGNSIFTNSNPNSTSNSQRFSKNLKSKAPMIGFPKPQKMISFADAKSRRHHCTRNARLFPNRSNSSGKSESVVIEPLSPRVSCIGRVRSKRDRSRRLRTRQRSISSSVTTTTTSTGSVVREKSSRSGRRKSGFFETVRAIFRSGRKGKPVQKPDISVGESTTTKKKTKGRKARGSSKASGNDASFKESVQSAPLGLGSMNRFASGRRSESWGVGEFESHVSI